MTVILVLLFICVMLSIDGIRQYRAKHAHFAVPEDAFVHDWGLTMACGGQKIEEPSPKAKEVVICPMCGAKKESK